MNYKNYKVTILSSSKKSREFIYKAKSKMTETILEKIKKENPSAIYITVSCNDQHEQQWINPNIS